MTCFLDHVKVVLLHLTPAARYDTSVSDYIDILAGFTTEIPNGVIVENRKLGCILIFKVFFTHVALN